MILAATTSKIEAVLAGTVAANQVQFSAAYSDITASAFTPGHNDGQTNNVTAVDVVGVPGASTQRAVKHLSFYNKDTAAVVLTVRYNANSTIRELVKVLLAPGGELTWSAEAGWREARNPYASDTEAGIIRIAGPGEVRGGTGLLTAISPGNQAYHPAMCKCWGKAVGAGTSLTVSFNVTSVTDTGTGRLGVTIATDMQGDYSIKCQVERTVTTYAVATVEDNNIRLASPQASAFEIESYNHTATTMVAQDPTNYFWACFGFWQIV